MKNNLPFLNLHKTKGAQKNNFPYHQDKTQLLSSRPNQPKSSAVPHFGMSENAFHQLSIQNGSGQDHHPVVTFPTYATVLQQHSGLPHPQETPLLKFPVLLSQSSLHPQQWKNISLAAAPGQQIKIIKPKESEKRGEKKQPFVQYLFQHLRAQSKKG